MNSSLVPSRVAHAGHAVVGESCQPSIAKVRTILGFIVKAQERLQLHDCSPRHQQYETVSNNWHQKRAPRPSLIIAFRGILQDFRVASLSGGQGSNLVTMADVQLLHRPVHPVLKKLGS